jgi:hypothetical protein
MIPKSGYQESDNGNTEHLTVMERRLVLIEIEQYGNS